jgi:hypothetical protein
MQLCLSVTLFWLKIAEPTSDASYNLEKRDGRSPCEEETERRPRKTPEERIYIYSGRALLIFPGGQLLNEGDRPLFLLLPHKPRKISLQSLRLV